MESYISNELNLRFPPIVLLKSDERPEDAKGPKPGKGGCVMSFVAQTIAKRVTTCFGRENISCGGIATGFGWGDGFSTPEDMDFQATFLSCGLESAPNKKSYEARLEKMSHVSEMFLEGERIYSDFETAITNIKNRPIYDEGQYLIFKGIENLKDGEDPKSVIFTLNPLELTVLIQLNTSFRTDNACLLTPQASACQSIGSFVFKQDESDDPVPILGPIDLAGRSKTRHFIPDEYLTLSMPWKLFLKLEEISKKSVLQTELWKNFLK